ncbi:MAG: permease [Clostridia bacterium]|nr:permease [Clostridia bacterium]
MKDTLKKYLVPIILVFVFIGLAIWAPETASRTSKVTFDYFKEMILIMPPVFLLMGLIEAWIPKEKIQKWLGSGSGVKGAAIAFALGTLPTGPLYMAFPMTASLIRKGAGIRNMVIFLGSWAALKIPQLMVEIKFLGAAFTSLRFVLTLSALVLIGVIMETLLRLRPDKTWLEKKDEDAPRMRQGKIKMQDPGK